ncbi:MAG: lipid-binding protein [Reichenbachiella sp.]|uniref:lipid-binding protein n=1 Tax=Reichenbachiella sp. TaxID=2184521 RepID=UPI0029665567|nr:lipid-binding protein [Reichenbachiella sp.]MDW3211508.1 lipid-binding protein [Reichenbachiella sp.]
MKNKVYKLFVIVISMGIITACELDDPEIEYTAVTELSGEWYVQYEYQETDGSWTNPHWGYYTVITSNTADNSEAEMLINDTEGWGTMYKVTVNGFNFSATEASELSGGSANVTVTNGIVIQDGGLSTSGVVTDSIHFEFVQPDDDPTVYRASGVRRTGFLEDEH